MNLKYILNVLCLDADRLPNILAREVIRRKVYWYRDWKLLGDKFGLPVDFAQGQVEVQLMSVVSALRDNWRAECIGRARTSAFHSQFIDLDFNLGDRTFLSDNRDIVTISWIMKCRGEMLDLNYKPWVVDKNYFCSLCNLHENETVFHFVARCPVFKDLRKCHLQKLSIDYHEFLSYLNGRDWRGLGNFIKLAWVRRRELINEFNF